MDKLEVLDIKAGSPPQAKVRLPNGSESWVRCVMGCNGWQPYTADVLAAITGSTSSHPIPANKRH